MTEQEIMRLEDNITSRVLSELRPSFEALGDKLESRIEKFVTKDIENIRTQNDKDHARYDKYHDQHFNDIKQINRDLNLQKDNLESQITQSKIATIREIAEENEKQNRVIKDIGDKVTKIEGISTGKKSNAALIISLISVASMIVGLLARFFTLGG